MSLARPRALAPGDAVAVVAPSSPFDREELERGIAALGERYRVVVRGDVFDRDAYLAGTDDRRAEELARAMEDDGVRAIACARGGYGAMRIVDRLPWKAFAERPKWIVGFSDVTALHVEATRAGVASVHAANVTGLGRDPGALEAWTECLEHPQRPRRWSGLTALREGSAEGTLVGGNLALVHAMAAAGRLALPDDAIVLLEDITEKPYRVDRMLTSLRLAGVFDRAAAIVFGGFTQCEPGPDGRTVEQVLTDLASAVPCPVLAGAPFGHGDANEPFIVGSHAWITADTLTWRAAL